MAAGGCGYSASTQKARSALDANNPKAALAEYNKLLGVESEKEAVRDLSGDHALHVLERSTILQQLEEYELSSRDFEAADKQVEMLDFEHGTADDIGRYLYSDDTGPYRAPAYEKVLINTLNMTNYLVRKDLSGARVEARRLAVMQKFLSEHEQTDHAWVGPGSYLAGFVFEQSGSFDEALTFYEEAAAHGLPRELAPQVIRLADRIGKKSSVIEELRKSVPAAPASEGSGELLVVVSYGRVPAKIARRIPIGLALTLVANDISPSNRARANELAAQGLVTWINYPEFPKPKPVRETAAVTIDKGRQESITAVYNIDSFAVESWQRGKGAMIASAITRLIARTGVGLGVGYAAKKATGNSLLGTLFSLGAQATMSGLDTPDTRSWATLPARIGVYRVTLPAGKHSVSV